MDSLTRSRTEIDRIDRAFLDLLAERMEAVRQIGEYKQEQKEHPLRDALRERDLYDFWVKEGEERGLSAYFVGRILREVLNYSRRDQERFLDEPARRSGAKVVRVGFQGARGAYSDLAMEKLFTSREVGGLERSGFHTFGEVLDALEANEVDYGLLPIENTIAGSINEVYSLLESRRVHIVDEEVWPVEHCLAGIPGADVHEVRVIRSHPVALQQCRRFLEGRVGGTSESWYDTAGAAESVAEAKDPTIAAICSADAARRAGLVVLEEGIADQAVNVTRFVLVAREPEKVDTRRPAKTSLIVTLNHRRGALAECLQAFARESVNLTKLESRPLVDAPWEYLFYIDVEGNATDANVAAALESVTEYTNHLRILGSYPQRAGEVNERTPSIATTEPEAPTCPAEPIKRAEAPRDKKLKLSAVREDSNRTVLRVGDVEFGGDRFVLIAGPCAVENRAQIQDAAAMVKRHGASLLRGGAFKPRSSTYDFQGLGLPGLELLAEAGEAYELPIVTEVVRPEDVRAVAERADVLQIGARSMQNFALLQELGSVHRTILLKRGMSATINELLHAAEYIMAAGNRRVILCERGIRTFETATRSTLDVSAVPVLKSRTHLPVIVDPSHAAGIRELVVPLALAAAAVGADGLIVEAHPRPEEALCDKAQALIEEDLERLWAGLEPIVRGQGRTL